jgi:uncharacterized membrane protein
MSPTLLSTLKTVHVVAAILFVGNVVVTGVWATVLFRARTGHGFRAAARAIIITDWIFTFAGGGVLVMSGVALSMGRGLSVWGTPWIRQALLALALSTAVWLAVLVPAQRAMGRADAHNDADLARTFHRWNVTGWLATIPLVYAVWCMVAKPGM